MHFALALAQLICCQKTSCQTFVHGVVTYVEIYKEFQTNIFLDCKQSVTYSLMQSSSVQCKKNF